MTINIPNRVFELYHEAMDLFLTNDHFSRDCVVYYAPIRESCANCNTNLLGGDSSNVFQHGGPAPFGQAGCVYCGGNGYREKEVTDTIRLRMLWKKKDWINPVGNLQIGDHQVQVIGYSSDLNKVIRAQYIKLISGQTSFESKFTLSGEPFFHGFGKDRYFVAYLKAA